MLATLSPITDEVIVYSFPGFKPGDERYSLAFALPIDTRDFEFFAEKLCKTEQDQCLIIR